MRIAVLVIGALVVAGIWNRARPPRRNDARFATRAHVQSLVVRGLDPGRIPIGRLADARWRASQTTLAVPRGDSVLIIGPTRSGKTSSVVIPALLAWEGPVVAASVKDDLVEGSLAWRSQRGTALVLDPSSPDRMGSAHFDPVALSSSYARARDLAATLATRSSPGAESHEMAFWSQLAAKLLGALLVGAHHRGGDLDTVARWVDRREESEPFDAVAATGDPRALDALRASWARDERQLSSVYATVETVIEPLLLDGRRAGTAIDPDELLATASTLYLCAAAHDQARHRPMFTALTTEVLRCAFARARREGGRLERPLLVVLDEAAAIAPLHELDVVAATCSSHGITLVTCFQDLAQITARYGERSTTVVNNHRTRLIVAGLADPAASALLGSMAGTTRDTGSPARLKGQAPHGERRALIESHELRSQPPHSAIVVSGRVPAVRVRLVPWWRQRSLRERGRPASDGYASVRDHLRRH